MQGEQGEASQGHGTLAIQSHGFRNNPRTSGPGPAGVGAEMRSGRQIGGTRAVGRSTQDNPKP